MIQPKVGDVIDGRYRLRREIDRGGVGAVFEAVHEVTARPVALKMLTEAHSGNQESRDRLLREARALTMARHHNVVHALDAGTVDGGLPYLVMELLEGRSLSGILAARSKIPAADAVAVGLQLCDALAHAHDRGILHRDVKPQNVFIARAETGDEVTKLCDFGLARLSGSAQVVDDKKLTEVGTVMGTAEYMAPEQLLGQEVDGRTDLYSVGVLLYECLIGTVPFEGKFGEVLLKISTTKLQTPIERNPDVPKALSDVVARALAKEPAERFENLRELARALADTIDTPVAVTSLLGIAAPPRHPGTTDGRGEPTTHRLPRRRRYARAPYVTPVRLKMTDGRHVDGRTEDISEGGLLVLTEQPCEMNAKVEIRFALPLTGRIATAGAVTRWARMVRGTGAAGVEFVELPDEVRAAIAEYVKFMGGQL